MEETLTKKEPFSPNKKMLLLCSPIFALAVLLSWISIIVNSDGVIGGNVYIVSALDLLISLCEIGIYATSLAFIVYAINEKKSIVLPCVIFFVLSAVRYAVAAFISGLVYGAISADDFISAATVLAIDTVVVGVLILIAYFVRKRTESKAAPQKEKALRPFMPDFSKTIDKCLFIWGIVWASIQLIAQLIYDISYITLIGAPSATNIMWMIIYYLFAILICPVFYLISSATVRFIRKGQDKSF